MKKNRVLTFNQAIEKSLTFSYRNIEKILQINNKAPILFKILGVLISFLLPTIYEAQRVFEILGLIINERKKLRYLQF